MLLLVPKSLEILNQRKGQDSLCLPNGLIYTQQEENKQRQIQPVILLGEMWRYERFLLMDPSGAIGQILSDCPMGYDWPIAIWLIYRTNCFWPIIGRAKKKFFFILNTPNDLKFLLSAIHTYLNGKIICFWLFSTKFWFFNNPSVMLILPSSVPVGNWSLNWTEITL